MNDLQAEVYEKFSTLQWLFQRQRIMAGSAHHPCLDPTRGQGRVLAFLRLQPEISTKDLSYLLGIRQQSLNELLNKLEKNGYVIRKPSDEDKRVMIVHLTDDGRQAQPEETSFDDILDCFNDDELSVFNEYLDRIIENLEKKVGDNGSDIKKWKAAARSRMGEDTFEKLMEMKAGLFRGGFNPFDCCKPTPAASCNDTPNSSTKE